MYRIEFKQTEYDQIMLAVEFGTKREANKYIKTLLKAGRIEKRGYDYFTKNRGLELLLNY